MASRRRDGATHGEQAFRSGYLAALEDAIQNYRETDDTEKLLHFISGVHWNMTRGEGEPEYPHDPSP